MSKAQKILAEVGQDIAGIDHKLGKLGHYFILYTHTYEQKDEIAKHVLCVPNDPKFDEAEFYGLILDMIRDYADNTNIELQYSKPFRAFIDTLEQLERNGDVK